MIEALSGWYLYLKWLHLLAVISWMAGLLYLPRLFVYHTETDAPEAKAVFTVMERKLLRGIMNPAMIVSWIAGLLLMIAAQAWSDGWFHVKLLFVIAMTVFHMACACWRRQLAEGTCTRTGRQFRFLNEVPAVIMIFIVGLAVLKPF